MERDRLGVLEEAIRSPNILDFKVNKILEGIRSFQISDFAYVQPLYVQNSVLVVHFHGKSKSAISPALGEEHVGYIGLWKKIIACYAETPEQSIVVQV